MATAEHWRTSQPELHKFIATIAEFVSDSSRRASWLRILAEYPNEMGAAEQAIEDWKLAKSKYMEQEIFESGNEHLRDRTKSPDDLFPQWHQRNLAPSEFDALPEHIRNAVYWDWNPASNEKQAIPCFRERLKNKERFCNELSVPFWCPLHFFKFDEGKRVHDPVPPSRTGRDGVGAERYTLAEICHTLTLLHDIDGTFGELAERDSQLFFHFNDESSILRMAAAEQANDDLAKDLQPLAKRLFDSIRAGVEPNPGVAGEGRPWDNNTLARNKYIYEQVMLGVEYTTVMLKCKKQADWEEVTTVPGVKDIVRRYAERFDLPKPPRRQSGRRKKADS